MTPSWNPAKTSCALVVLFFAVSGWAVAMSASDKDEYERLGLSQTEWAYYKDSRMSKAKLTTLMGIGITLPEYFKYPWLDLKISESEWIEKRRLGLIDGDIESQVSAQNAGVNDWAVVHNFFLPGYHEFKRKQYVRAWSMTGVAALAIAWGVSSTLKSKTFAPLFMVILLPDMVWSSVDIGIQVYHENNPDADRFNNGRIKFQLNMNF